MNMDELNLHEVQLIYTKLEEGSFGVRRKTFSEVSFNVDYHCDGIGTVLYVDIWQLFPDVQKSFDDYTPAQKAAFCKLKDFLNDDNLKRLRDELGEPHKDESSLNLLVAEEILYPLSGGVVFLDKLPKDGSKSQHVVCPGSDRSLKGLAFGFEEGYHGVPDMVVCPPTDTDTDKKEEKAVTVVAVGSENKDDDEDEVKQERTNDTSPGKSIVEGKKTSARIDLSDLSQCIATITTFAFIQQLRRRSEIEMFPMLLITSRGIVMLLYNPNNDVLLTSEVLEWKHKITFYVIWVSLHYNIFKPRPPTDELECGFKKIFEKYVNLSNYVYLERSFKNASQRKREIRSFLPLGITKKMKL